MPSALVFTTVHIGARIVPGQNCCLNSAAGCFVGRLLKIGSAASEIALGTIYAYKLSFMAPLKL